VAGTTAVAVRRYLDTRALRGIAIVLFTACLAGAVWLVPASVPGILRIPLRVTVACVMILLLAELNSHLVQLFGSACGVEFAPVHDHPYRTRRITAFWSVRWKRPGTRWFRQHAFLPVRGRSVTLAMLTLVRLSAAVHVYLITSVVSAAWMTMFRAFFIVQPIIMIAERRLHVRRWPTYLCRVWTFAVLAASLHGS
jgi:hypothetical protein